MVHKGEIIKEAVNQSGVSITQVAKGMGVTRKTIYNIFDRIDVDNDTILKIGRIIHYDFSIKFPKLKSLTKTEDPAEEYSSKTSTQLKQEVDHWKGKYIALLEDYNKLLKK
jgi:plasmid maintenance system antidote protein VapI